MLEHELNSGLAGGGSAEYQAAVIEKAQVALELAELQLERTEISLPYRFRVITSSAEVGELAGTVETTGRASVLGLVYRPESIRLDVPADPRDIEFLQPVVGRSAEVRANSNSFKATVTGKSSVVAPKSRLASLFLKFDAELVADEYPLPNTFVEIAIAGPSHENVYVLPEASERPYGHVWIVRGGLLESHETEVLGRTGDDLVVRAFDLGDGIVVGPLPNARQGLAVSAVPARD